MLAIKEEKFPLVRFDKELVEDRDATIAAGRRVTKNVDMVYIKQIGERDETPRVATEWIEQLRLKATGHNGMRPSIPVEWPEFAQKCYDNFLKGWETPANGTPVREWSILTPSQIANLHSMKTFTVEDISAWTENAMIMYGMGARELREKARLWLESGDAKTEQIQALQVESKSKDEQIKKQGDLIEQLSQRLAALEDDRPKLSLPKKQASN